MDTSSYVGNGSPVPDRSSRNARIAAMPKLSPAARARKIKLLLFDVDGVLTDGKIYLFPVPSDGQHKIVVEAKGFSAHDGAGISLARIGGLKTGLVTRRNSETVALRARDLKLDYVYQGITDKLAAFRAIIDKEGIDASAAAFVGDDVIDLPPMQNCGLSIAVANARSEVKKSAHYITPNAGGEGALRDAIEFILKAQGKWKQAVKEYVAGESNVGN
jgi:3-deoxy-D-manno-octulosonate 8-phosphate phosphatase (KDO 8-P phosphatase)